MTHVCAALTNWSAQQIGKGQASGTRIPFSRKASL